MVFLQPDIAARTGPGHRGGPLRSYAGVATLGGVALAAAHLWLVGPSVGLWLPGFILYGLGSMLAARALVRLYPHETLGLCNTVTQMRLALVALLVPILIAAGSGAPWLAVAVAGLVLTLDGLDGWLARRERRVSEFGGRFDMEVDSALALALAAGAFNAGTVGPVVLILGLARYAFWGASLVLPWMRAPLPERLSRKAVCVAQISVLVALQVPTLPDSIAVWATWLIVFALVWSFGTDIRFLWRHRRAVPLSAISDA